MKIDWFVLVRDILIVTVLGGLGTLAISLFLVGSPAWTQLVAAFVMLTAGFAISGSLKGAGRFKHLPLVALGVWCVNLLDTWRQGAENLLDAALQGAILIPVAMLIGGALSLAIRRSPPVPAPPAD